jgi:diacylglycerol kinase (ATP)
MPGIGIILNPHSRSNRQNPERITRLGFIVGDKGSCKQTQDIVDIPAIIHEFKEKKIDILGISGGDGTNHCTLSTLINEYGESDLPKIAFLRGGTMNAIANALNIHGSPEQILSNLILKYHEDQPFETTEVDLLNVNGKYGFIFGNGLFSKFIELYYENKGGPLSALWLVVKVVVGSLCNSRLARELGERFDAEVLIDGKSWGFKNFTFIDAGTMDHFSFGVRPLYRAKSRPGYFQAMGCTADPRSVVFGFPRIFLKKSQPKKYYEDTMGKRLEIRLNKPATYMVDGDMQDATDYIDINIGPRITVIVR